MAATPRLPILAAVLLSWCLIAAGCGDTVRPGKDLRVANATGVAGSWTIRLDLSKTTGTLNFRVQKAP